MLLKQIPEDFRVDELYDLEKLKGKESESEENRFFYFILTKKNYTVQRAIEHVCRTFKIQIRDVHFAGTKDRQAVTTQLISMRKLRKTWEDDVKHFNEVQKDLSLEFVGKFPARLNLGDNIGNKFTIVVRDLEDSEIEKARGKVVDIQKNGALNFFDSQRFGYGGANIKIGKYMLRGDFEKALFHILTAEPTNVRTEQKAFIEYLKENWKYIVENNDWSKALELIPDRMNYEIRMMEFVQKYKNDFLGAISLLNKKVRTMYVYSYQSYLFNEIIKYLDSTGELKNYQKLPLLAAESSLDAPWGSYAQQLMSKDGVNLSYFALPRSPTLRPREIMRPVYTPVNDLEFSEAENDELNEGKKKVVISFSLGSGSYATNVVKQLF